MVPPILREPLVHFLVIAALLFVANHLFSQDARKSIVLDWPTQEYLIKQREDLLLRDLTNAEKEQVIDNFIEEEILASEARERGFDATARIRTLLIQNMRFFLTNDLPDPTEAQLSKFFQDHPEKFATPPTISYDHVFFSNSATVPPDTLAILNAGADPATMGDSLPLTERRLIQIDRTTIARQFGPEQAPEILAIESEAWHGPYPSSQGTHFLRVVQRHPTRFPEFESVRDWVRTEWTMASSRELVEAELARVSEDYRIEIHGPEGKPG